MKFTPPLQSGRLLRRYKRFLADIELENGQVLTIHCANTGAMTGCAEPGSRVWFSTSDNPKRKYPHSWELTETTGGDFICVNTLQANRLVEEAWHRGEIAELQKYQSIKAEVPYGTEKSRIDFLLKAPELPDCYVEVKSVTLLGDNQQGYFPDAVTLRGQKHLRELADIAQKGQRAVLLFAVLHTGIDRVQVAAHIDEIYAKTLKDAQNTGVEILCYRAQINSQNMRICEAIPYTHK